MLWNPLKFFTQLRIFFDLSKNLSRNLSFAQEPAPGLMFGKLFGNRQRATVSRESHFLSMAKGCPSTETARKMVAIDAQGS